MNNLSKTYRMMATAYTREVDAPRDNEGIMRHITNLIVLFIALLNGLLGLRFLLKLMAFSESQPLPDAVYFTTFPFVGAFQGLMPIPSFQGGELEFFSLVAIVVYTLLGWLMIQVLWLLFTKAK